MISSDTAMETTLTDSGTMGVAYGGDSALLVSARSAPG